jgi:hypothetical protein
MTEQDNVGVQRTEGDDARPALKPWLFLDCDGVVSPLPPRDPEERERLGVPAGYFTFSRAFWSVYFDEWIRDWVSQLGRVFDIVWSSSWEEEMLWKLVCQPLGFPRWPSVEAGSFTGRNRVDYKAKAARAYLDQSPRPFAWVHPSSQNEPQQTTTPSRKCWSDQSARAMKTTSHGALRRYMPRR